MNATLHLPPEGVPAEMPRHADRAAARSARLGQLRAALKDRGWSAEVVTLSPGERAERVRDYALDGGGSDDKPEGS